MKKFLPMLYFEAEPYGFIFRSVIVSFGLVLEKDRVMQIVEFR